MLESTGWLDSSKTWEPGVRDDNYAARSRIHSWMIPDVEPTPRKLWVGEVLAKLAIIIQVLVHAAAVGDILLAVVGDGGNSEMMGSGQEHVGRSPV